MDRHREPGAAVLLGKGPRIWIVDVACVADLHSFKEAKLGRIGILAIGNDAAQGRGNIGGEAILNQGLPTLIRVELDDAALVKLSRQAAGGCEDFAPEVRAQRLMIYRSERWLRRGGLGAIQ